MLEKLLSLAKVHEAWCFVDTCKINFIMNKVNERRRLKGAKGVSICNMDEDFKKC